MGDGSVWAAGCRKWREEELKVDVKVEKDGLRKMIKEDLGIHKGRRSNNFFGNQVILANNTF